MARQFRIEVKYGAPLSATAEVYWHDNDTIEFATVPPNIGPDTLIGRTRLLEELMAYMKKQKVESVEVTRVEQVQLQEE